MQTCSVYASAASSQVVGQLNAGTLHVAYGKPRLYAGRVMVPILPQGVVELKDVKPWEAMGQLGGMSPLDPVFDGIRQILRRLF